MELVFSRILLAYDDSEVSRIALAYACSLARGGATLFIAHAVNESGIIATATMTPGFTSFHPSSLIAAADERGAAILKTAVDTCAKQGITAETIFIHDSPEIGIADVVRERGIDLVILGTHGRGGVARTVLGSVGEGIVRVSDVPVLTVTGHARLPREGVLFERALVALDDSDPSEAAMALASRLSLHMSTHLILCSVLASSFFNDLQEDSRKLLERAAATNSVYGSVDDLLVLGGKPAETIEHASMQHNCDLIIIGSHGRHGLERALLGSVAEAVIRRSALPVLVVPAKQIPATART